MSERVENIMQNYSQMVLERNCLKNQIQNFIGITADEMIETMVFYNGEGERIQTSNISNKTAHIAVAYEEKMNRANREWLRHLEKKYSILAEEINFFEAAIKSLSSNLSDVIWDMVIERFTWDELESKHHISRMTISRYRKKALQELNKLYILHDAELAEFILS